MVRMRADERRAVLVRAAFEEFARGGYEATATADIARRVGVSQAYLYKLFPTKRDLFLAAAEHCFARWYDLLGSAARGLAGQAAFDAMNDAALAEARGELSAFPLRLYAAGHASGLASAAARHVDGLRRTIVLAAGSDDARVDRLLAVVLLVHATSTLDLAAPLLLHTLADAAPAGEIPALLT